MEFLLMCSLGKIRLNRPVALWSIYYRFWVIRGRKIAPSKFSKLFYLWSDFNGVFSIGLLVKNATKVTLSIFFVSLTIFEIKGAQRGKKSDFLALAKFLFVIRFWWFFFPLEAELILEFNGFFISLDVFEIIVVKHVKKWFWRNIVSSI